ncbi:MAG: hypothetical protein PHN78_08390 [Dehalococcoidales bacterium]|nr:hypothetical protein [Dehalococcoidales bacterium]
MAALIVLTVVLVSVMGNNVTQLPENTPDGVVQHFLQAVQDGDYPRAYSYMKVAENAKPVTYEDWLTSVNRPLGIPSVSWRATLGETKITGDTAMVVVIIDIFQQQGPFQNPIRSQTEYFNLTKIDGTWYITTRPYIYWLY